MKDMPPKTPDILMFLTLREGPWTIHIHGPHTAEGYRHIHVKRKKLDGEYSWNIDGTRHDEHRFPNTENSIEAAKKMAAKHLGIDSSILYCTVAEPIAHVDLFIETESPRAKDGLVAGTFLLHCDDNALLLVFGIDTSPDIHVAIMRTETFQQEDGEGRS